MKRREFIGLVGERQRLGRWRRERSSRPARFGA